jgi:hypothetical protein
LLEAVEQVLQWKRNRENSVTFKNMFDRVIVAKNGKRSAPYLTALRCTLPRFAALHQKLACEISTSEIEDQLTGMTPSVPNAFLREARLQSCSGAGLQRIQELPFVLDSKDRL